jgi:predicted ester cyclase
MMEEGGKTMKKLVVFLCLMILACCILSAQAKAGTAMCEKKAKLLLDKVLEMWNKPNLDLIPELYAADTVATSSASPVPYTGHEGIRKWIESNRVSMPDMVMAFTEAVVQGDKIATIWTLTGTQTGPMVMPNGTLPPTGRKVRISGLAIDYLKDGKFVKEVVVFNALEMLMQLGFTLNPPQAPAAK